MNNAGLVFYFSFVFPITKLPNPQITKFLRPDAQSLMPNAYCPIPLVKGTIFAILIILYRNIAQFQGNFCLLMK